MTKIKNKIWLFTVFLIFIFALVFIDVSDVRLNTKTVDAATTITGEAPETEYNKGLVNHFQYLHGWHWDSPDNSWWLDNDDLSAWVENRATNSVGVYIKGDMNNAYVEVHYPGPTDTSDVASAPGNRYTDSTNGTGRIYFELYEQSGNIIASGDAGKSSCDMSSPDDKIVVFNNTFALEYGMDYYVKVKLNFSLENGSRQATYNFTYYSSYDETIGDFYNDTFNFTKNLDYYDGLTFTGNKILQNGVYYTNSAFSYNYYDGTASSSYGYYTPKIIMTINGSTKYNGNILTNTTVISNEGTYQFQLKNTTEDTIKSFKVVIDKTAPKLAYSGTKNGNIYGAGVTITTSTPSGDVAISKVTAERYKLSVDENGIVLGELIGSINIYDNTSLSDAGLYKITITDKLGNVGTEEITVLDCQGQDYNQKLIRTKGYFKTDNYKVTIPYLQTVEIPTVGKDGVESQYAGVYSNGNTYVFATYENALLFAKEIAIAAEVLVTDTDDQGNPIRWKYKQLNNSNASMTYTILSELYKSVESYAKRNVSDYGEVLLNSSVYIDEYTIVMDEDVYSVDSKSGIPFIGGEFTFQAYTVSLDTNVRTYTYTSLSQITIFKDNAVIYTGKYTSTQNFSAMAKDNVGLLTIQETDACGNIFVYQVYYDCVAPTITVDYEYYEWYLDAEGERQNGIHQESATLINGLEIETNLKSLSIADIDDIADTIVMARVTTPTDKITVTRDVSLLKFGIEGHFTEPGEYRVRVYDRSLNMFEFVFSIVGAQPKVTSYTKGLGDSKYLNISFSNADIYSSITHFTIYRYGQALPEGVYQELLEGEVINSMTISQDTWSYNLMLGGIYTIKFTDSFNRITVSEEIVFKKGLPEYTLKGVAENGKTNKAVSISFASRVGYEIKLDGKIKTGYGAQTTDGYKIEIPATIENNGAWEVKLYQKSDTYTYLTIEFIIDTLAPVATVKTEDGDLLYWSSCVNTPFKIDWDTGDNVEKVKYSSDAGYGKNYSKGTVISADGTYTITITDDVGNTSTYEIELDTTVKYSIDLTGKNYDKDGVIYVAQSFEVVDEENLLLSIIKDEVEVSSRFNLPISTEGRYEIIITDTIGNTVSQILIIDKSAPVISVTSGIDEFSPVKVNLQPLDISDYRITFNSKTVTKELSEEFVFEQWGSYAITVSDALGNKNSATFEIKKIAPMLTAHDVNGTTLDVNSITNKAVYFTWDDEAATGRISLNGGVARLYEQGTILPDEGIYTLTVTDEANNKVSHSVQVVKIIHFTFTTANGGTLESHVINGIEKTAEPFTVIADGELFVEAKKDGETFTYAFGQQISVDGEYKFYVYDALGNAETRTIVFDTVAPSMTVLPGIEDTMPVNVTLDMTDVDRIEVVCVAASTEKTTLFPKAEMLFSAWGKYTLTAYDSIGNSSEVTFEIKKIAPTLTVQTVSGRVLKDGDISREAIIVVCSENIVVKYTIGNSYALVYKNETILSEQGIYKITATDVAGNYVEMNITIDCDILFGVIMDGTTIREFTGLIVGKRYIELTAKEQLTIACSFNDGELVEIMEDIINVTEEGKYIFVLTDTAGNSFTLFFELDRTAPEISIDTAAITKSDVILSVADLNDIETYKVYKNGLTIPKYSLAKTNIFGEQGTYSISVSDALGNKNVLEFSIKREIEYKLSVANGFISEDKVTLILKESGLAITIKKDGQSLDFGNVQEYTFTENGTYEILIVDEVGNEKQLSFVIDPTEYRKNFTFDIPLDSEIKLLKDGLEIDVDPMITGDTLNVKGDGKYVFTIKREGVTSKYEFVIDTVIPNLLINGEAIGSERNVYRENLVLTCDKKTATMEVYYNGALIDYNGEELDDAGTYKVVLRDKVGNVIEYEFEREFTFNAGAIILFIVGGAAIALVIFLVIRHRIKQRIV